MNEEIDKLKLEIEELKNKNNELEEKLKSYTNPTHLPLSLTINTLFFTLCRMSQHST